MLVTARNFLIEDFSYCRECLKPFLLPGDSCRNMLERLAGQRAKLCQLLINVMLMLSILKCNFIILLERSVLSIASLATINVQTKLNLS